MQIRNPKYPFKQNGDWGKCPKCFEDFSFTSCANCGSGFEDEYIEVPSETDQLSTTITEQAERIVVQEQRIKALERELGLAELIVVQEQRIKALERELGLAEVTIDEMSSAAIKQFKRIKELEDALREATANAEIGKQMCGVLIGEVADLKDFAFANTDPIDMTKEHKLLWYKWFASRVN